MATTSPDNLRTPDPGDSYNLVPDLATLAGDVQAALILRDNNALRGTVAQRAAAESSALEGMLWVDTDGIQMLWRRGPSTWVPAVWHWSGTTTQMNAFAAPNGFTWRNTTDNSDYVRLSGAWQTSTIQSGRATVPAGNLGNVSGFWWGPTETITFPVAFPVGATPAVTANVALTTFQGYFVVLSEVTNASFKATVMRLGASPAATPVHWIARA